jgi:hypothetical protein
MSSSLTIRAALQLLYSSDPAPDSAEIYAKPVSGVNPNPPRLKHDSEPTLCIR